MTGVPDTHRYERKFAIAEVSLAEIERHVLHHPAMFRPEYAPRIVNNIYLDTPDLRNYRQNIDGHGHRSKLRVRWYGPLLGAVPHGALEQKCKSGHVGTKHSAPLHPFEFLETVSTRQVCGWLQASRLPPTLEHEARQVRPTLVNQYRRQYYRSADRQVRLTIDSELKFYRFHSHANSFLARCIVPSLVVVELKYPDSAGAAAAAVANQLPFRVTRMSKYVFGLNAVGTI